MGVVTCNRMMYHSGVEGWAAGCKLNAHCIGVTVPREKNDLADICHLRRFLHTKTYRNLTFRLNTNDKTAIEM